MRVLYGDSYITIDGEMYEVKVFREGVKLKKEIAYLKNDMLYVYYGKFKEQKTPGIYKTDDGDYMFIEPDTVDIEKYHISNVICLDVDEIFARMKECSPILSIENETVVLNNMESFKTNLKETDDFLKRAIKEAINRKNINLKVYKDKFKNAHSLNNMKSELNKSSKMSVAYFGDWCEILGLKWKLIVSDDGTDNISPLEDDIIIDFDSN